MPCPGDLCSGKGSRRPNIRVNQSDGGPPSSLASWTLHSQSNTTAMATVTPRVWHSTFVLTSWPLVTAAPGRLGPGEKEGGWKERERDGERKERSEGRERRGVKWKGERERDSERKERGRERRERWVVKDIKMTNEEASYFAHISVSVPTPSPALILCPNCVDGKGFIELGSMRKEHVTLGSSLLHNHCFNNKH